MIRHTDECFEGHDMGLHPESPERLVQKTAHVSDEDVRIVPCRGDLPPGQTTAQLARFLHESLKPWEDTLEDIHRGLDHALSDRPGEGGFVVLGTVGGDLAGAVVVLRTGMGGYVPNHLLLFAAVAPPRRGQGIGRALVERAVQTCDGDIALHVEYDNPARRLYERVGFRSDYAEMRYRT